LVTALRFVEGIYRGAILGLQKQVLFNSVNAFMATLRGGGAVLVLMFIQPTIQAYFIWQGIVSFFTVAAFIKITYSSLAETGQRGRFSRRELQKVWQFASGVVLTTFLAMALTQIDKIILSKILPLEEFGNYSLVATIAGVLIVLVGPIIQAHYPKIAELHSKDDIESLKAVFHRGAQLSTSISATAACVLFFFGDRIVSIWTGDPEMGSSVFTLLRLMTIGTFLNSLMQLPHILQLAYGWSGFTAKVNTIAVIFLVPTILLITPKYGPVGAAWVWIALNFGYVFIATHFMFRKILTREKWAWFIGDLLKPFVSALILVIIFRISKPEFASRFLEFAYFIFVGAISLLASLVFSSEIRSYIWPVKNDELRP